VSWCDFAIGYGPWIDPNTTGDQLFLPGHNRATRWGWGRRALYAVAFPLIPCVRFVRALRHLQHAESPRPSLARIAPVLALGLAADGVGQLVGYVAGSGTSPNILIAFEFRRIDFVPESDRHLWGEA
jgi:hypothetical protein